MRKLITPVSQTTLLMFSVVPLVFLVSCSTVRSTANVVESTANEVKSAGTAVINTTEIKSTSNAAKSLTVESAPDTDFIKHSGRQIKRADLPFQKVWIKPGFEKSSYQELIIAPVNTKYMLEMDWLHKASSANWVSDVKKDIKELAKYFRDQVVKEFKEDVKHRFQVIEHPQQSRKQALRLELALIEINPSTPMLHALSWASPIPGTGTAVGVANQRRAAFEGRLRDLRTGEVVATFADRDMADMGPIDLTRMTWYGPAKGIMDRWAKQFVQVANKKPGEAVTDPTAFTLMPF